MTTKMLINAGVCKIYYSEGYQDEQSTAMLESAHVELVHLSVEGDM